MGALRSGYAQHRPGEGLARVSSSFLSSQLSLPLEERGGRDRDFFTQEKRGKQSYHSFSGGGLVGFLVPLETVGLKFSSTHTRTRAHTHVHIWDRQLPWAHHSWSFLSVGVLRHHSYLSRPGLNLAPQARSSFLARLRRSPKGSPLDELKSGLCSPGQSRVVFGLPEPLAWLLQPYVSHSFTTL